MMGKSELAADTDGSNPGHVETMDENLTRIEGLSLGWVSILLPLLYDNSSASIHMFTIAFISCQGGGWRSGSGNLAVDTMITFATVLRRRTR